MDTLALQIEEVRDFLVETWGRRGRRRRRYGKVWVRRKSELLNRRTGAGVGGGESGGGGRWRCRAYRSALGSVAEGLQSV